MIARRVALGLVAATCACGPRSEESDYRALRLAFERGELQQTSARVDEAVRRAVSSRDVRWQRTYTVLKAEILVSQGRTHEALTLLSATGVVVDWPAELRARALMTSAYADCLLADGSRELKAVDADFASAEHLASGLPVEEVRAEVLLRRGTCAAIRGDSLAAETHLLSALAIARRLRLGLVEANATGSLGFLHLRAAHYDQAVVWLERSLDLATSLRMDNSALKTLGNLGWGYLQLGALDRALSSLRQAQTLAEKLGYTGVLRGSLTLVGNVHFRLGDYGQARGAWERALAISRDLGDKRAIVESLGSIAIVALEQRRFDEAEKCARDALGLALEIHDIADEEELHLVQARILAARGDAARAEALFRTVIASPHTTDAIRWETHAALATLCVGLRRFAEAEREFQAAFEVMEGMRSGLHVAEHKISFFSSLARYYTDYVELLMNEGKTSQALAVADRSRALYLREVLGDQNRARLPTDTRLPDVARAQHASLLLYWTAPDRSYVWCVTPERTYVHELPGQEVLAERVRAYQRLVLHSRDPLAEGNDDGTWLYRTLVGPVAAHLQGSRVILVPDGPLHELSFETLIVPSPKPHYWIEDVTLALAPALSLLDVTAAAVNSADGRERSILLIGDPLPAGSEFPSLPSAGEEMKRIASQFPTERRVIYGQAAAEPGAYRTALPERFAFIHFSAHATPSFEQPIESAVILSPKGDAFKLYARDIIATPLDAELVTLSACYGAGSRHYAGEGFVGLAWAFLGSGARNVVAGLWNVEETSTVELMAALYRGLAEGLAPPDALRQAQLGLLHSESAYRKPYYWAPFVTYTRHWAAARPALDRP